MFSYNCYKRVLISSAATSALRLHQRLPVSVHLIVFSIMFSSQFRLGDCNNIGLYHTRDQYFSRALIGQLGGDQPSTVFTSKQPKKNKVAFVSILSQIKLLFRPLVIKLLWCILKQLFTAVVVKVVDIYLHFGELLLIIVHINNRVRSLLQICQDVNDINSIYTAWQSVNIRWNSGFCFIPPKKNKRWKEIYLCSQANCVVETAWWRS